MHAQIQDWINEKNVRFGLKLEDLGHIQSGEVCLAGVLNDPAPDQPKLGRGAHGMVVLVDVVDTEPAAIAMLDKVQKELEEAGAERQPIDPIGAVEVTRWKLPPRPQLPGVERSAFHAIAGGWLVATDNENIFRDIIRRITEPEDVVETETLAAQPAFAKIQEQTRVAEYTPHLKWFIDPIGYIYLAQAIADEEQEFRQRRDDWVGPLKKLGFDVFQGIGGSASLATGDHELLHRTFVYTPQADPETTGRAFGLFDFKNRQGRSLLPPAFVPQDAAAYFTMTWDMSKAMTNVGDVVDTFMKEPGLFDNMLDSFKTDLKIDLAEVVQAMDNQIFVVSQTRQPIDEESECVLIAVPLRKNGDVVFDAFRKNLIGKPNELKIGDIAVLEIDTTVVEADFQDIEDPFSESIDDGFGDDEMDEEEAPQEFSLFEKRYVAMHKGYLLVANRKEYIEQILSLTQDQELHQCDDYQAVAESLAKLTDEKRVAFRQFGRVDQALKTNYEMMRQGKMGSSNTVLARILNRVLASEDQEGVREQKFDATQLPENYDQAVAPYFGPVGWVLEVADDGWLVTGVALKNECRSGDATPAVPRVAEVEGEAKVESSGGAPEEAGNDESGGDESGDDESGDDESNDG